MANRINGRTADSTPRCAHGGIVTSGASDRRFWEAAEYGVVGLVLLLSLLQASFAPRAYGTSISQVGKLTFSGEIPEADQMSGVARVGRLFIVGVDEGKTLLVLAPTSQRNVYRMQGGGIALPAEGAGEADIEGVAVRDGTVFVVGSHSLKRKEAKADKSYKKNRERIEEVESEESRDAIYRFRLDPETGEVNGSIDRVSLRKALKKDPVLGRFTEVPSKENGIDIEGIATDEHELYVGFRGPVLRDNFVPVMVLDFDAPEHYELRYVALGGNGIRDLARVRDGFLILSGPVGDGAGQFGLYFWDGGDTIPGTDRTAARLSLLGKIPTRKDSKAEGLAVMEETATHYNVLVVYDGEPVGNPTLFSVQKPNR